MFFRLRARYLVANRLTLGATEARQKGLFLHKMLDVELRRAHAGEDVSSDSDQSVPMIAIAPPQDERSSYAEGESFEFDINVFAWTADALAVVAMALSRLAGSGGKRVEPMLQLIRLSAVTPGRLPLTLYDADSQPDFLELDTPAIDVDALCAPIAVAQGALSLDTVTPLIITSSTKRRLGLNADAPKLGRLVRAVLRRCNDCWPEALVALTRQTKRDALEAHADGLDRNKGAVLEEPSPADALRYRSSTHATPLRFAGYTGRIVVNDGWQPLLPVLRVGSWTQVGQKTALGFGVYRLSMIAPINAGDLSATSFSTVNQWG